MNFKQNSGTTACDRPGVLYSVLFSRSPRRRIPASRVPAGRRGGIVPLRLATSARTTGTLFQRFQALAQISVPDRGLPPPVAPPPDPRFAGAPPAGGAPAYFSVSAISAGSGSSGTLVTGSITRNVEPSPGPESTSIFPPHRSRIRATSVSPMPFPSEACERSP